MESAIRFQKDSMEKQILDSVCTCDMPEIRYECVKEAKRADDTSLLTVITRTQGKRPEELNEVLLCLAAQSDQRFTHTIICHNAEHEKVQDVLEMIDAYPADVRDRTSVVTVEGGGRARPLNVGLAIAATELVSFLDDDDIVLGNWVESFLEAAAEHPHSIVHSYAVAQAWEVGELFGSRIMRAIGSPDPIYCNPFDPMRQFVVNSCPIMSLAFPTSLVSDFNLWFNEELSTTEDWDFLMRASQVYPVVETHEVSSIYRQWQNAENSMNVHTVREWRKNESEIRASFDSRPVVFPAGYASRFASAAAVGIASPIPEHSVRLHNLDHPEHVDGRLGRVSFDYETGTTSICFSDFNYPPRTKVYISLPDEGLYTLRDVKVECTAHGESIGSYDAVDFDTTGLLIDEHTIACIDYAPFIRFRLPREAATDSLTVSFKYENRIQRDILRGTKLALMANAKKMHLARKIARREGN